MEGGEEEGRRSRRSHSYVPVAWSKAGREEGLTGRVPWLRVGECQVRAAAGCPSPGNNLRPQSLAGTLMHLSIEDATMRRPERELQTVQAWLW